MAGRPPGSKNKQRSPEKLAELRARREQRRALKAAAATRGSNGGPGSNAASLTDDQARALHYIHVGEYEKAEAAVKRAMAARKTAIARIRSDGGDIEQVKASIALQTPEGEERIVADIKRKSQAARWAGVGLQLDLFDQDRADATQQYELGKTAGLRGITPTTQDQDWLTGWHAGQDALRATLDLFRAEPRKVEDKESEPEAIAAPEPEDPEADQARWDDMTGQTMEPLGEDLTEGEVEVLDENLADHIEGAPV